MKATLNKEDWISLLKEEGFQKIEIVKFEPGKEVEEHTHEQLTVHVMLQGELTLFEKNGDKILQRGDRYDIPKGTRHTAKAGPRGSTFIVGFK